MDIKQLAANIVVFIAPFIPYLVRVGESMVAEVGKQFGEDAWNKAKALWNKVHNIAQNDPKFTSASSGLADNPDDEDYQLILAKSLCLQLEAFPELTLELLAIMKGDDVIQEILVEQESRVKDIHQSLTKPGRQETIVRKSQAGNITQEQ